MGKPGYIRGFTPSYCGQPYSIHVHTAGSSHARLTPLLAPQIPNLAMNTDCPVHSYAPSPIFLTSCHACTMSEGGNRCRCQISRASTSVSPSSIRSPSSPPSSLLFSPWSKGPSLLGPLKYIKQQHDFKVHREAYPPTLSSARWKVIKSRSSPTWHAGTDMFLVWSWYKNIRLSRALSVDDVKVKDGESVWDNLQSLADGPRIGVARTPTTSGPNDETSSSPTQAGPGQTERTARGHEHPIQLIPFDLFTSRYPSLPRLLHFQQTANYQAYGIYLLWKTHGERNTTRWDSFLAANIQSLVCPTEEQPWTKLVSTPPMTDKERPLQELAGLGHSNTRSSPRDLTLSAPVALPSFSLRFPCQHHQRAAEAYYQVCARRWPPRHHKEHRSLDIPPRQQTSISPPGDGVPRTIQQCSEARSHH